MSRAELLEVDREPALARELRRHLDREAVRRLSAKASSPLTAPLAAASSKSLQPARERLAEPLLLRGEHALDCLPLLGELRVDLAHLLDDDVRRAAAGRSSRPTSRACARRRGGRPGGARSRGPRSTASRRRRRGTVIPRPWSASTRCAFVAVLVSVPGDARSPPRSRP